MTELVGTVLDINPMIGKQSGGVFCVDGLRKPSKGHGFLSSKFPDALVTLDGEPVQAEIRILYRPVSGANGDGVIVASTRSSPSGQWRVDGLNPNLTYDVVARLDGNNDTIIAKVKPKLD